VGEGFVFVVFVFIVVFACAFAFVARACFIGSATQRKVERAAFK